MDSMLFPFPNPLLLKGVEEMPVLPFVSTGTSPLVAGADAEFSVSSLHLLSSFDWVAVLRMGDLDVDDDAVLRSLESKSLPLCDPPASLFPLLEPPFSLSLESLLAHRVSSSLSSVKSLLEPRRSLSLSLSLLWLDFSL